MDSDGSGANMTTRKPNMIVIFPDQLRRTALGCYGDPNVCTPHIDRLADAGVTFDAACSTYPICVPFRFTLMTGQYAHTRMIPAIEWRMSPAERTLAHEFNDAGYETIYVGKWHLYGGDGYTSDKYHRKGKNVVLNRTPVPRRHQGGWQKWLGFEISNDFFNTCYFEDDSIEAQRIKGYQTDGLFALAQNYLSQRDRSKPFLCMLSVEPPHDPFVPPQQDMDRWKDRDITLPNNFEADKPYDFRHEDAAPNFHDRSHGAERREMLLTMRRNYYAMIENLDDNVGRMMTFLRDQGIDDNTIVVLLSDHGELGGAHGLTRKSWPYEESVGIPLIIYDPRRGGATARRINSPTATEDLLPTLCGLAGVPCRMDVCGVNLAPMVWDQHATCDREAVYLEFVNELRPHCAFHMMTWRAVRSQRYKYTVLGDRFRSQPWQFFDLLEDPGEQNNLVAERASQALIEDHHRMLRERLVTSADHFVLSPAFGMAGANEVAN